MRNEELEMRNIKNGYSIPNSSYLTSIFSFLASLRLGVIIKNKKVLIVFVIGIIILIFILSYREPFRDTPFSPVLYDRNGQLLGAQVSQDGQWRFPGTDTLNEKFVTALLLAEDHRFRYHPGVDPIAVVRASVQNVRGGRIVSGGSTITMQTIRLSRGAARRTFGEKIIEAILAIRLEVRCSKQKILALYSANAPFGGNVVGLEAAAWRWFGRSSEDLSWAEAATLAVLPNSPALIHPGRNRAALKEKRDTLLRRLNEKGFLDNETLVLSVAESLPGQPLPLPRLAPHLLDRLVLSAGPGAFTTTIERDTQERAAAILNRASVRFAENGIFNGAVLVLNTQTGEPIAYVGNTDTPHAGSVDIISSWRSSGSLLKPFLYAAMLDSGDIFPASLVSDIPTRVGSFSPENITRTYLGVVPADQALARSLNVPAARMLRVYGVDRFARLLRALGLTTLFRPGDEYGLPLILGGAEVTLWEITGLYAGLGRAVDARTNTAPPFFPPAVFARQPLSNPRSPASQSLISPGAAWLTLEALVSVARPGEEAIWQEFASSRRIAWKTGTSYGFRDAWAVGVTPEWTVGVWIGNASGAGRAELRSAVTAAPVMFEIFSSLDSIGGNRGTWFRQPAVELRHGEVCASSGFAAGIHCANISVTELPVNALAGRSCPYCRTVVLNENLDRRITLAHGVNAPVIERKWFVLPPAEEWYFRRWNLDYRPLPPFDTEQLLPGHQQDSRIALFNPEPNSRIFVPRELDGQEGRVVFSAAHRDEWGIIYWHLGDRFLGLTQNFHEMEARPPAGPQTLTLIDSEGNTLAREFVILNSD